MRLPGDALFIIGGVLPLLYLAFQGARHTRPASEAPEIEPLYTEAAAER